MFREMRRKKQVLSEEDCRAVLERGTNGVLATAGDDGYPYAVPLSYVFADDRIYFHTAKSGHKIDAISETDKVSFCVVDMDKIVASEFTTYFRSVIVFGRARILEDKDEITEVLVKLAKKYSPDEGKESVDKEISSTFNNVAVVEISVEHMSGKEAIELVNQK